MKLTKTFYYQFGSEFTPDALFPNPVVIPTNFPAPSGEYLLPLEPYEVDYTAHIPINIPFKVQTIHIKNITYTRGMAGNQGGVITPDVSFYVNALSSLVGNKPVGVVHADSKFSANTKQDIKHTFQLPQVINGIYDFNFFTSDGVLFEPFQYYIVLMTPAWYFFFDSFSITIEFNSEYEN
jgi:hypothetical protein